jgi:aspartyl-tRNA(Asn)/glutamyl-tRNA(Gln) amidotransferase subunit C
MKIDEKQIEKIARLARINVPENKKEKIAGEFAEIITYVESIGELDLSGIEPMERPGNEPLPLRADEIRGTLPVDKALENAPDKSGNKFRVPKVI